MYPTGTKRVPLWAELNQNRFAESGRFLVWAVAWMWIWMYCH